MKRYIVLMLIGVAMLWATTGQTVIDFLRVKNITAPATPPPGTIAVYANANQLCTKNSSGTVSCGLGGGSGPTLETNGTTNGSQSLLNLQQGTGVTITDGGTGTVTISASGSGGNVFENRQLNTVSQKAVACSAGSTCTIASVSGAGTMVHLQFAAAGGNGHTVNDGSIKITVDGSVVLNAPTGAVFGTYINGGASSTTAQLYSSPRIALTRSDVGDMEGIVNWIIPFSSSLLVQWVNNASGTVSANIYSNVDYYSGAPPTGLYPSAIQSGSFHSVFNAFATVAHYATATLLSTVSTTGMLGSIQLYAFNTGVITPYWLEGQPSITIDGTAYTYNGTEDLFCGSFFFAYFKGNITGSCGSSYIGSFSGGFGTGVYRFFYDDRQITFSSSLGITWPNGVSGSGDPGTVTWASLVTYYTVP